MKVPRKIKKAFKYLRVLSTNPFTISSSWFSVRSYGVTNVKYRTKWVRKAKKIAYGMEMSKMTEAMVEALRNKTFDVPTFHQSDDWWFSWDVVNEKII